MGGGSVVRAERALGSIQNGSLFDHTRFRGSVAWPGDRGILGRHLLVPHFENWPCGFTADLAGIQTMIRSVPSECSPVLAFFLRLEPLLNRGEILRLFDDPFANG